MRSTATALTVFLLFGTHSSIVSRETVEEPNRGHSPDQVTSMVREYIRGGNVDLTAEERTYVLQSGRIDEVIGWPFLDRFKAHRLFAFQKGWNRQAYALVAVGAGAKVWQLADEADFNELLRDEGIVISSEEEARDLARLFLKCRRVSTVMYYKWDLGMNLLTTLDDIDFRDEAEKREVAKEISVEPPRLTKRGDLFEYVLYSWDKYGAGALRQHKVVINSTAVLDYQVTLLRPDVGRWQPL